MESIKDRRRWSMTKLLLGSVMLGFFMTVGLAIFSIPTTGVTVAYATYVSFSAAIIATNLATRPSDVE